MLRPAIQFVEAYKSRRGKLPDNAEFQLWAQANYQDMVELTAGDVTSAARQKGGGKHRGDYCLRVWRGERWTYYYSWNKQYEVSDET